MDKEHRLLNRPDLNPLNYSIWDELAQHFNWHAVMSKTALISALKRAVRKVYLDVVFESCSFWTNRLYRWFQGNGHCLK